MPGVPLHQSNRFRVERRRPFRAVTTIRESRALLRGRKRRRRLKRQRLGVRNRRRFPLRRLPASSSSPRSRRRRGRRRRGALAVTTTRSTTTAAMIKTQASFPGGEEQRRGGRRRSRRSVQRHRHRFHRVFFVCFLFWRNTTQRTPAEERISTFFFIFSFFRSRSGVFDRENVAFSSQVFSLSLSLRLYS